MSINLNAIQARADAATEGPWDRLDAQIRHTQIDGWTDPEGRRKAQEQTERDIEFVMNARTDVPAIIAYARDLEARLKEAKVAAIREAADDMDEVIARGDVADVAAPVEGSVGRPEAISSRDSLYEELSHWLRGYADALEDETIRAALTATEDRA